MVIPGTALRWIRDALRANAPGLSRYFSRFHLSQDRELLETVILPFLRDDPAVQRILFVGCEWYTKPYEPLFRTKEYWTLEIDARKRRFGARRHVTDALKNLVKHAPTAYFDAIVCNGVFMKTAIEARDEAEASFEACRRCLGPGGWFVLGWNDTEELRPFPPMESTTLGLLEPHIFPPLGVHEYLTGTTYRHTYTFFRSPRPGPPRSTVAPAMWPALRSYDGRLGTGTDFRMVYSEHPDVGQTSD
jgi:SAM-dependent methyltransferase